MTKELFFANEDGRIDVSEAADRFAERCQSEDSEDWCVVYKRVDKSNATRYVR